MEQSDEEWTEKLFELFRERRLAIHKIPIAQLDRMILGLKKFKSECTEAIDIFQVFLYKKKQLVQNENYTQTIREFYCMKYDEIQNTQEYRFFQEFDDMMNLKQEYFQDGDYQLDQPYSSAEEEEEKRRNVKDSMFEVENILKKDLREFTFLLFYLFRADRINFIRVPVYHIIRFIQGLKWFKKERIQEIEYLEILLAFKEEALKQSSEKNSRRNKQFLKKKHSQKVVQNMNQNNASEWNDQFVLLGQYNGHDFRDGCYIEGLISQHSLAKDLLYFTAREKSSKGQNPSIFEISILVHHDNFYIFQESFFLKSAEKFAKASRGQNFTVVKCQRGIQYRFNQVFICIPITVKMFREEDTAEKATHQKVTANSTRKEVQIKKEKGSNFYQRIFSLKSSVSNLFIHKLEGVEEKFIHNEKLKGE